MRFLVIVILFIAQVQAVMIECNEESFAKGDWEAEKIRALVDIATPDTETQAVSGHSTNEDNLAQLLSELENRLDSLTKNSSDLFKARLLNQENIRRWKSLEKTCENESFSKAEKSSMDAETLKGLIQTRMTSVRERIDATKTRIESTKQAILNRPK